MRRYAFCGPQQPGIVRVNVCAATELNRRKRRLDHIQAAPDAAITEAIARKPKGDDFVVRLWLVRVKRMARRRDVAELRDLLHLLRFLHRLLCEFLG